MKCKDCNGTGQLEPGTVDLSDMLPCPTCGGSGEVDKQADKVEQIKTKIKPPTRKQILDIHKDSDRFPFNPDKPLYKRLFEAGQQDAIKQIANLFSDSEIRRDERKQIEEWLLKQPVDDSGHIILFQSEAYQLKQGVIGSNKRE